MAVPIKWVCRKCGRVVMSSENPARSNTNRGKCPKSSSGEHSWTRG